MQNTTGANQTAAMDKVKAKYVEVDLVLLTKLTKTVNHLLANQYSLNKALYEVSRGFGLSKSDLQVLIQHMRRNK